MTQETVTNGTEALFTREGMPPVKEMIPCALQHCTCVPGERVHLWQGVTH